MNKFTEYIKLLRIPQWIKNLFVFVPLLFSKNLFFTDCFSLSLRAFCCFCAASSAVYIMNDILDRKQDALHPVKKNRPVASGKIKPVQAMLLMGVLVAIISVLLTGLNERFSFALFGYMLLNALYSLKLKHLVIIDIISIAAGFMLRVLGGAYVIGVYVSSWLVLTTMFISLFMAIMKRRSELSLGAEESNGVTRKVLSEYSLSFTEQMASISAAGVIICYALYSVSEKTIEYLNGESLVYTTIFVVFGIFRFMYLVYKKSKGENATEIMLTDIPMIVNIILYVVVTVFIVYS